MAGRSCLGDLTAKVSQAYINQLYILVYFGMQRWYAALVCSIGMQRWYAALVCSIGVQRWYAALVCSVGVQRWCAALVCSVGMQRWYAALVCSWYAVLGGPSLGPKRFFSTYP